MVIFQLGSVILLIFISLRNKMFKEKHKSTATHVFKANGNWFAIETEVLENFVLNALIVFILSEVTFVINKINLMSPIDSNLFPNYLYVNVYQLVNPIVICGMISFVYFLKHTKMKNYFHRQLIDCNQ
jgi:hypothetical protein